VDVDASKTEDEPRASSGGTNRPFRTTLPFVTPASWADDMRAHTAELLVEQAHLEKKAAATAMSFMFRLRSGIERQRVLTALAREELVHFERTLRLLDRRGIAFGTQPPSGYAERLKAAVAPTMPARLVDELLVSAIIEARSCERMALLADALRAHDGELAAFYNDLCEAEARHESAYLAIAAELAPQHVTARLQALARHEAAVLRQLPRSARLHSGIAEVPLDA
jgi:tRNA-(ms[2]io[6]A)-hydroxylase